MSCITITSKPQFEKFLSADSKYDYLLVDFSAEWCGPCKRISPYIESVAPKYPHIGVLKVDIDKNSDIADEFDIRAVPTFVLFRRNSEGELVPADHAEGASQKKVDQLLMSCSTLKF